MFLHAVPGTGRIALPGRMKGVDMDGVPLNELGQHLQQTVDAPLGKAFLPLAGIAHAVDDLAMILLAAHEESAAAVAGDHVPGDVFLPERAGLVGIEHIDVQADCGVVFACLGDQPLETVERGGILLALERRVDRPPIWISPVVPARLPANQVDDLGNPQGQTIYFADDFECLLEGDPPAPGRIRVSLLAEEQFQGQGFVVFPEERADDKS